MILAWLPLLGLVDGAPGLTRTKAEVREHDCERISVEEARRRYPGQVAPRKPRGDYVERSVLVCAERLMPGLRAPGDEMILSNLEARTSRFAQAAAALRPDLAERTWLVEAFHASGAVAEKIDFATKNALVQAGLRVSDRAPVLAAGDVGVLTRMAPLDAYPAACRRYADAGSLDDDDVLLAIVHLDPRETALHAGLCLDGRWTWLR